MKRLTARVSRNKERIIPMSDSVSCRFVPLAVQVKLPPKVIAELNRIGNKLKGEYRLEHVDVLSLAVCELVHKYKGKI
ncbi:hypothetical protein K6R49_003732 [Escherichia coli]|uniref:hypothetical protein n=1 Tax=Buttiauxella noackiae TaxID=82992 RepID=UPI001A03DA4D|nr:hypothetical protein [Escherichia coli]MBJ0329700.1 hypothetical protein [Escherichia coli]